MIWGRERKEEGDSKKKRERKDRYMRRKKGEIYEEKECTFSSVIWAIEFKNLIAF